MMSDKPEANPTVIEIVRSWLQEHGYDGLFCHHGCSCGLDKRGYRLRVIDDCPPLPYCRAGYRAKDKDEEGFWIIVPEKPAAK
jgi:hypothetical protein